MSYFLRVDIYMYTERAFIVHVRTYISIYTYANKKIKKKYEAID